MLGSCVLFRNDPSLRPLSPSGVAGIGSGFTTAGDATSVISLGSSSDVLSKRTQNQQL